MRCHISACMPSVCGVTVAGSTSGITTLTHRAAATAPPSRPTIPVTDAPTSLA